jgi:hypothetical protein
MWWVNPPATPFDPGNITATAIFNIPAGFTGQAVPTTIILGAEGRTFSYTSNQYTGTEVANFTNGNITTWWIATPGGTPAGTLIIDTINALPGYSSYTNDSVAGGPDGIAGNVNPGQWSPGSAAAAPPPPITFNYKSFMFQAAFAAEDVAETFEEASLVTGGIVDPKTIGGDIALFTAVKIVDNTSLSHDIITGQVFDLNIDALTVIKDIVKRVPTTNPIAFTFGVLSSGFDFLRMVSTVIALDSPDPNYETVATPQAISLPSTGNATADKADNDYLQYVGVEIAIVHAYERWQGAAMAGSATYETLQQNALQQYQNQAASLQDTLIQDNAALSSMLPSVNVNSLPGGATALAAAITAQCGQPLDSETNSELLSLGLTQAEINTAVCQVVSSVTANSISTDFTAALSSMSSAFQ